MFYISPHNTASTCCQDLRLFNIICFILSVIFIVIILTLPFIRYSRNSGYWLLLPVSLHRSGIGPKEDWAKRETLCYVSFNATDIQGQTKTSFEHIHSHFKFMWQFTCILEFYQIITWFYDFADVVIQALYQNCIIRHHNCINFS